MTNEALTSLVGPVDKFFSDYWAKEPLLSKGTGTAGDVISLSEVEHALNMGSIQVPSLRLARNGRPVPSEAFTGASEVAHRMTYGVVDATRVSRLLSSGATMVIDAAERVFPRVAELCTSLTSELDIPVDANIYVTPSGATGFGPHWDAQDVFLVQFFGAKVWSVYSPVQDNPVAGGQVVDEDLNLRLSATLSEGDVLFIPRGFVHQGTAVTGQGSAHVTFSANTPTAYSVLLKLARRMSNVTGAGLPVLPRGLRNESSSAELSSAVLLMLEALSAAASEHGDEGGLEPVAEKLSLATSLSGPKGE